MLKRRIKLIFHNFDVTLACVGFIVSLLLFIYLFSISSRFIYMLATFMFLATCLAYLAFKKFSLSMTVAFESNRVIRNERTLFVYSSIVFFFLFTAQSIILINRPDLYSRPASYLLITCILAGIIGIEIATVSINRKKSILVLTKILMVVISFTLSQQLLFPESLLGVDPWKYATYSEQMLNSGAVLDGWAYSGLPLFDLEIGTTQLITDLDYKLSSMMSVGLIQTICDILFVFLIGRSIWSDKVGLFAALVVGLADQHINLNLAPIATTMAATFVMAAIFLIVVKMDKERIRFTSLLLLFFIAVVLTHTVTALCLTIILLTFIFWPTIYGRFFDASAPPKSFRLIVTACIILMMSWWIVGSGQFYRIVNTINRAFRFDFSNETTPSDPYLLSVNSYVNSLPISEIIFQRIGMLTFFAIAVFGCLLFLSRRKNNANHSSLAICGLIILVIGFLPFASAMGMMHRWWYYAQLILAPFVAMTVLTWVLPIKVPSLKAAFTFSITVALVALSIFNPVANTDNPYMAEDLSHRSALTHVELYGAIALTNMAESRITTDQYYRMAIAYNPYTNSDGIVAIDFSRGLISNNYSNPNYGLIVIRDEVANNSFLCYGQFYKLDYDPHISAVDQGLNRVYDAQYIYAYYL